MSPRSRALSIATVSSAALLLAGCAGAEGEGDTVTLSYAFFGPATSFASAQIENWADELEERSDGRATVEVFLGGTLLGSGDIFEGVSQGVVDVGLDSPAYDFSRFPLSSVINVPIGLTDPVASSQTFLDLLLEFEPEEFEDYEIVTAFTTEASYLQTVAPASNRGDLAGTTLRGNASNISILEQLGTNPVGLPMNEVSEQLSTGVLDGYASSREVLKDFGLAESVKYVTDYPLGISNSFVAVMSKDAFAALPEDIQQIIRDLREESSQFAAEQHVTGLEEAAVFADEQGVEFVPVDPDEVAVWDEIVQNRADEWVAANEGESFDAQAVLDRARELAAENE